MTTKRGRKPSWVLTTGTVVVTEMDRANTAHYRLPTEPGWPFVHDRVPVELAHLQQAIFTPGAKIWSVWGCPYDGQLIRWHLAWLDTGHVWISQRRDENERLVLCFDDGERGFALMQMHGNIRADLEWDPAEAVRDVA